MRAAQPQRAIRCENLLRLRRALLETEGPWPASQSPISTKKLGSNPALSFQRLVLSKANTLTVSRMSSSRWGWRLTPTTLELYVELHFAAWPAVERAVYSCNLSCV